MKALVIALTLIATAASAQDTRTVKLFDKVTKEVIATVTFNGPTAYFHSKDGKHLATVVRNPDGTRSAYDPRGILIDLTTVPQL